MGIKPLFSGNNSSTKTHSISEMLLNNAILSETIETQALSSQNIKLKDPEGIIPNGIYKVFSLEKSIKVFMAFVETFIFMGALIIALLFGLKATWFKLENNIAPWTWFIVPVGSMGLSLTLFVLDLIEYLGIKKSIVMYRDSIKAGAVSTPPFISLLYRKLMMKQVRKTWLVVAILFYVGLFTVILWALQNQKWGELDWKTWIHKSFPNPNTVVYILCGIMSLVLVLFVINTIIRKKRMVDIQSFFGNESLDYNSLQEDKSKAHRFWAKVFFISVLVLLVLPFIIWILIKKFGGKK
ncbi:MSC_0882 family membrane protein [[Mycoplasma] anseris]|uniref:Uncharacterized protein n=1 Tax=[Mycoplasma] anseris TaxID=92400 RepID=A0A2Z4NDC4_9BACT|nr:hypothetical protein [[Mycoplasma] anseris]AWX69594.1 hypothetical protein DP065_02440 [[Mycoplasma] anseris]